MESPGGYLHAIRSQVWAGPYIGTLAGEASRWCVFGKLTNESSPGATQSVLTGGIHKTRSELVDFDVSDLEYLDLSEFLELFVLDVPDPNDSPDAPAEYECNSPCIWATGFTEHLILTGAVIKQEAAFVFGTHRISVGDWHWSAGYADGPAVAYVTPAGFSPSGFQAIVNGLIEDIA